MSDFPPPPRDPNPQYEPEEVPKPNTTLRLFFVSFTLLVVVASFIGAWRVLNRVEPEARQASPSASPERLPITQAELDAKVKVAAFYLGRNQPEGASQVLSDLLSGSSCRLEYAGWGAANTRKELQASHDRFLTEAGAANPGSLLSTATVKADNPEEVGGKYVGTGVMVRCV